MDKKHNNLAQPESEWMVNQIKDVSNTIDPHDHTGIKMKSAQEEVKLK